MNKQLTDVLKKAQSTLNQLKSLGNTRWGLPEKERVKLLKANAFLFYTRKLTLSSSHQSLRLLFFLDLKAPPRKYPNALQASLGAEMLRDFLLHRPESIKILHGTTLLTTSVPMTYFNLELDKKTAITRTQKLIKEKEGQTANIAAAVVPERQIVSTAALGKERIISNHECEVYGLLLATMIILEKVPRSVKNVFVLISNQGTIIHTRDIAASKPGQYIFQIIIDNLNVASSKLKINLVWCPGHSKIIGNKVADQAAKEACQKNNSPEVLDQVRSNVKKTQRVIIKSHLPSTYPTSFPSPIHIAFRALINQLATGQVALNYHLFPIERTYDPSCPCCGHKETTQHYLNFFQAYKANRIILRRSLRQREIKFNPNNLQSVLKRLAAHVDLAKYIQATN
ncbi:hypothetical protein MJO28_006393 [Puccinia striiformis f. sp. tritici]|uniref:Uncharacterized protein n=1 Tax=Puccinia striiformis f. sp. tritici TaxID=168172 RepID=A0ACC0EKA6_9BASI|nr:hypothetical protein MJO28_006393 [Puccinia striiformis f. sp. tritici]